MCDGGLVIDLSLMKAIEMDAPSGTVRAQAGVLWAELDRATQASGPAVPGGTDSEVGIAGLTLGGGNGWLMGLYGATCDNLLAADVVMADGRSVSASDAENGDLFWALRGGGGNFGSSPRSAIAFIPLVRRSSAARSCMRIRTLGKSCAGSGSSHRRLPIR